MCVIIILKHVSNKAKQYTCDENVGYHTIAPAAL